MDRILAVRLLCRVSAARTAVTKQQFHSSVRLLSAKDSSSSSDSSDSDVDKSKKIKQKKERDETAKQETVDLLNDLLAKLTKGNAVNKTIDLAMPVKKPAPKKVKEKTLEEKIKVAAKDVAQSLGGDVQKKEEELLEKIFSAGAPASPSMLPIPPTKKSKKKSKKQKKQVAQEKQEKELMAKTEVTATQEEISQQEEVPQKEEVPTEKLKEIIAKSKKLPGQEEEVVEPSMSDLLAAMKMKRSPTIFPEEDLSFAKTSKILELARKFQATDAAQNINRFDIRARREVPVDLYGGKAFGIFGRPTAPIDSIPPKLSTWEALQEQELKVLVSHPPQNYFEEMIQWTERGILWKFPIDNEYGMEAEQNVHFSEHVFLEKHMADWCPRKGPIRHFMELVCTGLSKNPYMTVEEKKEHIMWYRDYFGDKQQLLKDIGAIEKDILPDGESPKQIQA